MATWNKRRAAQMAAEEAKYGESLSRVREAKVERSTPKSTPLPPRLAAVLLSVLTMNVVLALPAAAAAGDLDASFDGDGKVTTDLGGFDTANGVAIQADGRIVAAGTGTASVDFALARYNRDGSLDTDFGGDGNVTTDFGGSDGAEGVAVQPDGKIVAAGGGAADFALARYNRDGSLDTSFHGDGKVTTDFGGLDAAVGVAIQPNGRIVAAGFAAGSADFALARYNRDGSLDTSFDGDGMVTTDFGGSMFEAAAGVAIQPDGRIVAAGFTQSDFALARYNRDGSLDTSFDGDGKVTTDFGGTDFAFGGLAIQPDGRIVAAGGGAPGDDFALARYNRDGSLDTSFDGDGKVTTDFGASDQASAIAIQSGGKIVAAGHRAESVGINWALARYNRDGSLDTASTATARSPRTSKGWGKRRSEWQSNPAARSWPPGATRTGRTSPWPATWAGKKVRSAPALDRRLPVRRGLPMRPVTQHQPSSLCRRMLETFGHAPQLHRIARLNLVYVVDFA